MKLNVDCIRDILITVEDNTDFHTVFNYRKENTYPHLSDYSHEEIIYHILQCKMSDLLVDVHFCDDGDSIYISDLSPAGHEFLANSRTKNVWKKIKAAGATSLPIVINLAKDFALAYFQTL